jgi:hypothetical protein
VSGGVPVRVELGRRSATVSGGSDVEHALRITGARWMRHPTRRRGWIQVHADDVADVVAALEADRRAVQVVGRDGKPVVLGGMFGGGA